jgi:DNA-binding NtrC family response regulator
MLRVLLIDDHPDDRTLVIRQLQHEFAQVEVEQIIDQASFDQALKANRFDIAITDYRLIWSDGLTVLRQLKTACPTCPVIMFTNSAMQEEAIEAMKAGLDDYIIKSPRHYIRLATAARLALERAADRHKANQLEMRLQGQTFQGVLPISLIIG